MRVIPVFIIAAVLSGCAATPAETARAQQRQAAAELALGKELAGLQPVSTASCLNPGETRSAQTVSYGPTILYKVSRNRIYRTDTAGGCEGIARGDILVTNSTTGQTCRGDIASTIDHVARSHTGSCSFGDFTLYIRK